MDYSRLKSIITHTLYEYFTVKINNNLYFIGLFHGKNQ